MERRTWAEAGSRRQIVPAAERNLFEMKAALGALAGIGGATALVFSTSILPLPLLLRAGHWIPAGDPRLVVLTVQVFSLALVLFVLRVPVRPLLRGLPSRAGLKAGSWLTLGTFLFSLLVSTTIVATSGFDARSDPADILQRWAREFPATGLAGHFAFYAVFVPTFEELLYRAVMLGHFMRLLPPWLALVVSALLFAAGHPSWFFSGLSGLAYGLLYLRYRNIWLCVLAHSAHNLFSSAGATLLVAYLHDIRFSPPVEVNLLVIQIGWTFVTLACFTMFLRYVVGKKAGGPSVLLRVPHASAASETTGLCR